MSTMRHGNPVERETKSAHYPQRQSAKRRKAVMFGGLDAHHPREWEGFHNPAQDVKMREGR